MTHTLSWLAAAPLALLIGCGGKSPAAADLANANTSAAVVPAGIHACQFVLDGTAYGPHRCDLAAGKIDKLSGMELFSGTIDRSADGAVLSATIGCTDMTVTCEQAFSVALRKDADTWRGPVVASDGASGWWLAGATFELVDSAGYGGATYGDDWAQGE